MEPLVTAVITTYHREKEVLKKSIDSVLNQTYKNIELLVIDDNGKDSEYHLIVDELIHNYDVNNKKITLITHEENHGVQRARNNGLKNARGEFVGFLDDDDEWLPDKIEKQVQLFEEHNTKDLALVYGWYLQFIQDDNNQSKTRIRKSPEYTDDRAFDELLRINYIGSTSVPLLRRESVIKVGGFDETFPASQDYDLWLRLTLQYKIRCINEPLARYFIHPGERITTNPAKKELASRMILSKYIDYFKNNKIAFGNKMIILGENLIGQNKFNEGRSCYKKSIKLLPNYKDKIYITLLVLKSYWLELMN